MEIKNSDAAVKAYAKLFRKPNGLKRYRILAHRLQYAVAPASNMGF
ncbi:hypothetical protein [Polynucleobacter sphagniphilus]|nr:hypothetical protein [Polynucleobacter sphagniphilus]